MADQLSGSSNVGWGEGIVTLGPDHASSSDGDEVVIKPAVLPDERDAEDRLARVPSSVDHEPVTDPLIQEECRAVVLGLTTDDRAAREWSGFTLSMVSKMSALTAQLCGNPADSTANTAGAYSTVHDELAALRDRVAQLESERDGHLLAGISAQLSGIQRTLQDRTVDLERMRMRNMELHTKHLAANADCDQLRAELVKNCRLEE